ncbi:MAG: ABC transporter ATP-binding protein [Cystobacterineae bacterium]|nr:ABC transporter ATP-binding protein [Cystobacterineae bacterium]
MNKTADPQHAVVEAVGLTKHFGAEVAVEGVSFRLYAGEVLGILGANGSGKTTLLRMLSGLMRPTAGQTLIEGMDVLEPSLKARRQVGFLTGNTRLYEKLSPRDILHIFGELYGLSGLALSNRINSLAEEMHLHAFLDKRCGQLSSGMRQRVSVARALVADPSLYVLDEPTATLDPMASHDIVQLVQKAKARGRAVVFSTHRMEEIEYLCDRVLFLRKGRMATQGTLEALKQQSGKLRLIDLFLHFAQGEL